ncbi:MAG: UPF0175 family protein, partial [Dehalococcoidia bacterium]
LLGGRDQAAGRVRRAAVLDLMRAGEIGESLAAALLGLTRRQIIDLMADQQIPAGPRSSEEIDLELDRILKEAGDR